MTDSVNYTGQKKQGLAILCLVMGILSIIFSVVVIGLIFGLVGLLVGIIRIIQKPVKKGMLWTGLVLSIIGICFSLFIGYFYFAVIYPAIKLAVQSVPEGNTKPVDIQNLAGPIPLDFSILIPRYDLQKVWSQPIKSGKIMNLGDWDLDGSQDILAVVDGSAMEIYTNDGIKIGECLFPGSYTHMEYGFISPGQPVILGHSTWSRKVDIVSPDGKILWSYRTPSGVNDARWGDLDGDGFTELVAGLNGGGGLHAVNGNGQSIWVAKNIGNAWTQAVIPMNSNHPGYVITTEAGGSIRIYSSTGQLLNTLHPMGVYVSPINAADIDGYNFQIIGQTDIYQNQKLNFVIDTAGNILWKCEVVNDKPYGPWHNLFSHGDLNGDGIQEWAFRRNPDELVVISAQGNLLAQLSTSTTLQDFKILTRKGNPGLLCLMEPNQLMVYEIGKNISVDSTKQEE